MTDPSTTSHDERALVVDDRRWVIETETVATNRDNTTRTRTGRIEIDSAQRILPRPVTSYSAIPAIANMLWLDAFPGGPWTPSAVNEIVVVRDHDTITYRRESLNGGRLPRPDAEQPADGSGTAA